MNIKNIYTTVTGYVVGLPLILHAVLPVFDTSIVNGKINWLLLISGLGAIAFGHKAADATGTA